MHSPFFSHLPDIQYIFGESRLWKLFIEIASSSSSTLLYPTRPIKIGRRERKTHFRVMSSSRKTSTATVPPLSPLPGGGKTRFSDLPQEDPGLCTMCYLQWCASPKFWCRALCFLVTVAHGAVYAFVACLLILDLRLTSYSPLFEVILEKGRKKRRAVAEAKNLRTNFRQFISHLKKKLL